MTVPTFSVTGTYSFTSDGFEGSRQAPGRVVAAETAEAAAEEYRETVLVPLLVDLGVYRPRTNVCAVALDGAPGYYSDPLEGVPCHHAERWTMRRQMRRRDLYAAASREMRYGLGVQPAIAGRSRMRNRELADALDAREQAARADRENWGMYATSWND